MCACNRRTLLIGAAVCLATPAGAASYSRTEILVMKAFKMRLVSVQNGDQPYGAIVARRGLNYAHGHGESLVRQLGEGVGHAERVAIRMAQVRLGTADLSGCEMYSTSRPCRACESAAAEAKIDRMYYGREPIDAGVPRP